MKKLIVIGMMSMVLTTGCGDTIEETSSVTESGTMENSTVENATMENDLTQNNPLQNNAMEENMVVGKITEVYGNQIMVQLAQNNMNLMTGEMGMQGNMPNGEVGQNGNRTELSEDKSQMGEVMANKGEASVDFNGDRSQMMEERGAVAGEMNEDKSQTGGQMNGDKTQMMEERNMTNVTGSMAEQIVLTEEIVTYTIPVGTPVMQMGMELSFSQLAAESYVILQISDDTILSIQVVQ